MLEMIRFALICRRCESAPCVAACPQEALEKIPSDRHDAGILKRAALLVMAVFYSPLILLGLPWAMAEKLRKRDYRQVLFMVPGLVLLALYLWLVVVSLFSEFGQPRVTIDF